MDLGQQTLASKSMVDYCCQGQGTGIKIKKAIRFPALGRLPFTDDAHRTLGLWERVRAKLKATEPRHPPGGIASSASAQ
jgi:hypothetical protein